MFNWSGLNGKEKVQLIGTPVAYCLLMGGGLGAWARRPYDSLTLNALYWSAELGVAALIYMVVIGVGRGVFKFRFKAGFKGHWLFSTAAFICIFLVNLAWSTLLPSMGAGKAFLLLFLQIITAMSIGEMVMGLTRYWDVMALFLSDRPGQPPDVAESSRPLHSEIKTEDVLSIGKGVGKRSIRKADISYIAVSNHFSTIIYRTDTGWCEWGEYMPLADLEHQCVNLLRINRSTLVNPGKISSIEKSGRQFILRMKGDPDGAFRVSRSKNQLIQKLMQTAAIAGVRAEPDS